MNSTAELLFSISADDAQAQARLQAFREVTATVCSAVGSNFAELGAAGIAAQTELADALNQTTAAEEAQTTATEGLAAAHAHAVSEIQATSGALRVFEGSGGIRAAERFIATTLGIGTAMQAIFPIVGAIAFTGPRCQTYRGRPNVSHWRVP